ncbi:hypothetical protein [Sandaracinus amylolyticus]|uniref:hypothetical protein n=1 Tax=Sandaracinus amylolyticus TaxID=927083 RepID=UPI001F326629|nr:hypothetical protein [Sandaracinus amylolyticus]UJR85847.1 Hypothetical protein I5071_79270 [Sandaracinus amylolyticus]
MTAAIALYLGLTIVLASWIVVHALATTAAWRREGASPGSRALALVPPFTAIAAARAGHRHVAGAWAVLAVIYVVLLGIASQL